ncbi:hypothetical protein OK016_24545 [Vibrio chagasii]|nr:hypothetical protein [Vibrio chagasii]
MYQARAALATARANVTNASGSERAKQQMVNRVKKNSCESSIIGA